MLQCRTVNVRSTGSFLCSCRRCFYMLVVLGSVQTLEEPRHGRAGARKAQSSCCLLPSGSSRTSAVFMDA